MLTTYAVLSFKDKRSNLSVLSSAESLRFKRAMYRLWAICLRVAKNDGDRPSEAAVAHLATLLEPFVQDEVLELYAVIWFIRMTDLWTEIASSRVHEDYVPRGLTVLGKLLTFDTASQG